MAGKDNLNWSEVYPHEGEVVIKYVLEHQRIQKADNQNKQIPQFWDGKACFSTHSTTPTNVTVFRFFDRRYAYNVYDNHNRVASSVGLKGAAPYLANLRFLCETSSYVDIGYDKIPTFNLYEWQIEPKSKYIFSEDGNEVVGLQKDIRLIMKKIMRGLEALHLGDCYHGNLNWGHWFDMDANFNVEVRFTNFSDGGDIKYGLKQDMIWFYGLLNWVIKANPSGCHDVKPIDVCNLESHIDELIHSDLKTLRNKAYFIYNHPIFNNSVQNHAILRKLHSIKSRDRAAFNSGVPLKKYKGWHKHNSVSGYDGYFRPDYSYGPDAYQRCTSLLDFHVNAEKHHQQNNSHNATADDDSNVVCDKLQKLFPGFVSEIYSQFSRFDMTNKSPWRQSNLTLLKDAIDGINR